MSKITETKKKAPGKPSVELGPTMAGSEILVACLEREGVDEAGLDAMDRRILQALISHRGNPVGVKTIAVMVGEEEDTIEEVYEPFLIQEGYVLKTSRGRLLGAKGYEHLGLKPPAQVEGDPGLF